MSKLKQLWRDESGATTVETTLFVAMCALGTIAAWQHLARSVQGQVDASSEILADH